MPQRRQGADGQEAVPESETRAARQSRLLDEALEESFPASDPPSPMHL